MKKRREKKKGCPEGHSMQTKLGKNGQPMRDADGKVIKSCQIDKKEMKKIYIGTEKQVQPNDFYDLKV